MSVRTLRGRLLLVLLIVIMAFWLCWSYLFIAYMTREQSGWLDNSLREIAHQVLTSLPEDIATLSSDSEPLSVADDAVSRHHKMSFQIWALPDTLVLRSMESPESALAPRFADGFGEARIDDREWRVYAVTDTTGRIQVQTGQPMEVLELSFWKWLKATLMVALLFFAILGAALWKIIWASLRPITQLREDIAGRDRFDVKPLSAAGLPGELQPLIESFNRLLLRIDRAIRNERQFITDAAHELRTPMAAVQAHAQVALNAGDPDEKRDALKCLIAAVERGTRLAQQLLDSARLESSHGSDHEHVDLAELVSMVTHEFDAIARQNGQTVSLNARACPIRGDVDELGILVRNLIDNALRYSGEGSRVEVHCGVDGERAVLSVSDDGPGLPDETDRERIFDRFYRSNGNGQRGSGIGLSLVRGIAESHGARLDSGESEAGCGFSITVTFEAIPVSQ